MKILEKTNKKTDLEIGDLIIWTENGEKKYRFVVEVYPYYITVLLDRGVIGSKFDSLKQMYDFYSSLTDFKVIKNEDLQLIF